MSPRLIVLAFTLIFLGACASSTPKGRLFVVPKKPAINKQYLFYLHEAKLEDLAPDHKHVQNYEKMISLLTDKGFIVFSEHRDLVIVESYAKKISAQVDRLIQRGVPASHISVVGYSKGSLIAQSVAEKVANPHINYVFLAGCSDTRPLSRSRLQGRVLSIIDSNDHVFHSCKKKLARRKGGLEFKEIRLNSGLGHNVFRVPREKFTRLWQEPMIEWLALAKN